MQNRQVVYIRQRDWERIERMKEAKKKKRKKALQLCTPTPLWLFALVLIIVLVQDFKRRHLIRLWWLIFNMSFALNCCLWFWISVCVRVLLASVLQNFLLPNSNFSKSYCILQNNSFLCFPSCFQRLLLIRY